ncbi:uncharacterized protein LOC117649269 [Thrips palmi]|uniref:Uncharacterized protein LOC117649269 n=1 Tax=Thrips palmi TaxID=161013 RepID=A0A6P8ZRK5_THRPL|nr:uncharacterized protein LOC117649269 [Thrips palmi]
MSVQQYVAMLFKVVVFVAAAVVVAAPAAAFEASDCSEVPGCLNEYQWKHKVDQARAQAFCADRYKTCKNADGSDMKQYCKVASPQCVLFVFEYIGLDDKAKKQAQDFCKKRLPRCQ